MSHFLLRDSFTYIYIYIYIFVLQFFFVGWFLAEGTVKGESNTNYTRARPKGEDPGSRTPINVPCVCVCQCVTHFRFM